ncbi:MAG: bifunctional adenosylcobinamide kinase/adenosylcobinamide-phosphate guanylyltransferase [Syntrophobacteraceae bacterium]|nr:bifunctional adenosylcobinamide kinase/adenosylcobinamide-phosphate guanylyltransferase [Desulfobacteraceae bacterium]
MTPSPHLILGASRSGKSTHAESLVTSLSPPYVYIATARILDPEMRDRVRLHRERRSSHWETLEAPVALLPALRTLQGAGKPVLLDCLTLWLTNLLLEPSTTPPEQTVDELCSFLAVADYPLFVVSNEVGAGIVPENALARRFRDLAGLANQRVAASCAAVTLVVAGIPLRLK